MNEVDLMREAINAVKCATSEDCDCGCSEELSEDYTEGKYGDSIYEIVGNLLEKYASDIKDEEILAKIKEALVDAYQAGRDEKSD